MLPIVPPPRILFHSFRASFLGVMEHGLSFSALTEASAGPRHQVAGLRKTTTLTFSTRVLGLALLSHYLQAFEEKKLLKLNNLTRFYAVHIKTG